MCRRQLMNAVHEVEEAYEKYKIYMGEEDTIRQALHVFRMRLLGAKVHPVKTGTATLKDAVSEAFREWTKQDR